jgi:hypothetical protein
MSNPEKKAGRLQEWILIEAYKNGQSRLSGEGVTGASGTEAPDHYFICRHDIYQRFFRLPIDAFLREAEPGGTVRRQVKLRLKSAAILCESVKELLRSGLIQFPERAFAKKSQAELLRIYASFIFLTEAGVRKAESLLSGFQYPAEPDGTCGPWAPPSRLKPGNAIPLSVS